MKYNVGDKVRIKSISDIGKLIDDKGYVGNLPFGHTMNLFCGKVMTISWVCADCYTMVEDLENYYCDEMIECKEEEYEKLTKTAQDFAVDILTKVKECYFDDLDVEMVAEAYMAGYKDAINKRI